MRIVVWCLIVAALGALAGGYLSQAEFQGVVERFDPNNGIGIGANDPAEKISAAMHEAGTALPPTAGAVVEVSNGKVHNFRQHGDGIEGLPRVLGAQYRSQAPQVVQRGDVVSGVHDQRVGAKRGSAGKSGAGDRVLDGCVARFGLSQGSLHFDQRSEAADVDPDGQREGREIGASGGRGDQARFGQRDGRTGREESDLQLS